VSIKWVSKPKKWIIKTKSPIGSIKTSVEERIVIPKRIEKGIIETPVEIEKSPRIVIYVIYLSFIGAISPRCLRIDLKIVVTFITSIVITIGVSNVFSVIQRGVIVSNVTEIIFIIDFAVIRFRLLQSAFSESHFTSINTI
tara:strand:- start:979 stop:1401 length:423 start_codon:yes stop_codon:yes gene_type:complete